MDYIQQTIIIFMVIIKDIEMNSKKFQLIVLILKLGVFLSLSIIFYVYYFSDIARKYHNEHIP